VEIKDTLPYNDYFEYYGPDYKLHLPVSNMENLNSKDHLDLVTIQAKRLSHPSVRITHDSFNARNNVLARKQCNRSRFTDACSGVGYFEEHPSSSERTNRNGPSSRLTRLIAEAGTR
jgi:hypothetical protein